MIPFKYGLIVGKECFCGREELVKIVDELFISSQNVVVHGERRMGKSSLIAEVIRQNKKLKGIFVDFSMVKSESDVYQRLAKSVFSYDYKQSILKILVSGLSNLRPQLGIDPITQLPTVSIDTKMKYEDGSLEQILRTIEAINAKEKVVVVLDEFQDITKLKDSNVILAKLRAKIQFMTDVTFVYAGSVRNEMSYVFSSSNSPFFKSAFPITVESLQRDVFEKFLVAKFKKGKRVLSKELIDQIFSITQNITGDVQQLCEAIWTVSSYSDKLDINCLSDALNIIYAHEQSAYDRVIFDLTEFQTKVLVNVANIGGCEISSNAFLEEGGFTNPSSVKRAIDKLVKIEVLFRPLKEYKFVNPFFRMWLRKQFL